MDRDRNKPTAVPTSGGPTRPFRSEGIPRAWPPILPFRLSKALVFRTRFFLALLFLTLVFLVGACADPVYRKRSFVGRTEGKRQSVEVPVGLNPLGSLDTCIPGSPSSDEPVGGAFQQADRVLVSRPENFTHEASLMISALREELGQPKQSLPPVEFLLADRPIKDRDEAKNLGIGCGALIVLWEPGFTKTLELTLPHPAQIPLRHLLQERLCEFGNHQEQLNILYLTIAGLLTLRDNDYDRAVFFMESARSIDNGCLRIGGKQSAE